MDQRSKKKIPYPKRAFYPSACNFLTMSATANCDRATVMPYPGTIIMLLASFKLAIRLSTVETVISPSITVTSPPTAGAAVPVPPNVTDTMHRPHKNKNTVKKTMGRSDDKCLTHSFTHYPCKNRT